MPRRVRSGEARQQQEAQMHLRTSERGSFKRCPQRWWWNAREGLSSKSPSLALWFGSGIHLALAHYYDKGFKRNLDFIEVWEQYCNDTPDSELIDIKTGTEDGDDVKIDARALGISMLRGYHEFHGGDKHWDVIATEKAFQVMIPLPDGSKVEYDGTFDGVYRDKEDGRIKLMEHKTCKSIPNGGHLLLDDQAGSYWAVSQTILRKSGVLNARETIHGVQYNYLRKAMPSEKPRNPDGYVTNKPQKIHYIEALLAYNKTLNITPSEELEESLPKMKLMDLEILAAKQDVEVWGEVSKVQPQALYWRTFVKRSQKEIKSQIQRIKDESMWIKAVESGQLPLVKRPTMDCSWDCSFYEMCQLHEQGGDISEYKRLMYAKVDPYADHRDIKPA